jgi:hypothetical protein
MKEFMLFTREKREDEYSIFQGDFDDAWEALDRAAYFHDDDFYKIVSFESNRILAEGPIRKLFNLIIGREHDSRIKSQVCCEG